VSAGALTAGEHVVVAPLLDALVDRRGEVELVCVGPTVVTLVHPAMVEDQGKRKRALDKEIF
jgi:hypothetical protein